MSEIYDESCELAIGMSNEKDSYKPVIESERYNFIWEEERNIFCLISQTKTGSTYVEFDLYKIQFAKERSKEKFN
jgi:hypothetical protein